MPVVLFGIWFAKDRGGVHPSAVAEVFVAIVPLVLPKLYVTVCVNEDEAREIYIVPPLPRAVDAMLMVDLLGMVYSATV